MKKFVKENLHEEDISPSAIPPANPGIAQKLGQMQIALNKEDLKLQNLTTKMMMINKRKAQIQKQMVKTQEENAREMQKSAKETAKQDQMNQQAAEQAAQAQASAAQTQTPVQPVGESLLQTEYDELDLFEDYIVVLMGQENPDYEEINSLIEARLEYWECPGCGKSVEFGSQEGGAGVCNDCEENGLWVDPAGGVHQEPENDEDFYDPASMYESNPMSKENFYLNEEDEEKKTEDEVSEDYIHYIKVYEGEEWFIAKIFKIDPEDDWYGEVKAGESNNFNNISYDPDYDLIDIIHFLRDTYDSVEVIDDAEYNDYVEETPPGELDEEGGVTGMHL